VRADYTIITIIIYTSAFKCFTRSKRNTGKGKTHIIILYMYVATRPNGINHRVVADGFKRHVIVYRPPNGFVSKSESGTPKTRGINVYMYILSYTTYTTKAILLLFLLCVACAGSNKVIIMSGHRCSNIVCC